jgi:ribose/xylose/arabinose/galactoside ABC-type transport system permease subunit
MMATLGKVLIIFGVVLVISGGLLLFAGRQFPFLGRLPGDIHITGERFEFYFPLTTCLIISAVLTLILFLLFR